MVCCHTGTGPDNRPLLLYLAAEALDDFVPIHDGGYVDGGRNLDGRRERFRRTAKLYNYCRLIGGHDDSICGNRLVLSTYFVVDDADFELLCPRTSRRQQPGLAMEMAAMAAMADIVDADIADITALTLSAV